MAKTNITLFVGNGVNHADKTAISWNDLLMEISREDTKLISSELGMTLRYEYIDAVAEERSIEIKRTVAEITQAKATEITGKTNSIHRQIMGLPIKTILTTNYDYSLELSVDKRFAPVQTTRERVYSFYRKQHIADKTIYHIHGECRYPNSICLGFEHYAGMLEKMRSRLVKSTETPDKTNKFHLHDVLTGIEQADEAWYYDFFRNDIIFLGFGVDPSEEDVWWLITYRRKLKEQYPDLIRNRLIYIDTIPIGKRTKADEAKEKVLNAMDVEIHRTEGRTYREKYQNAIAFLKEITTAEEQRNV